MPTLPESLIRMADFTPLSMRFPYGWCGHLPFAAWLVQILAPNMFVELGTHSGNSYFTFCQAVKAARLPTRCHAVDTWQGDEHAGQYGDDIFGAVSAHNQEHYAAFSTLLRQTFDDAADYFSAGSIDLLHIDGLHTYDAVRHDFETWLPKLAPDAVVLFHDTNVRERGFGVWQMWEELCASHPWHLEFMHSHGLGVLRRGDAPLPAHLAWLQPGSAAQTLVVDFFSAQGRHQLDRAELATTRSALADRERQIAELRQTELELRQTVLDRDTRIVDLHHAIDERDARALTLHQAVAERDAEIHRLTSSRSWRLTRPLRGVTRVARALRARKSLPCDALLTARAELHRHGMVGFLRRIPYYVRNVGAYLDRMTAHPLHGGANLFSSAPAPLREARLHPDLTGPHAPLKATVSVVIPTLNAGPEFSRLLRKLHAQQGLGGLEIVIVDSGSTDGTLACARAAQCTVVEIPPSAFTHSFARNKGAEAASGEYLLFMVQDAYPIGDYWLHGMLRFLLDHAPDNLAAVSCAEYSRSDSDMMYDSMINTHYRFLGCLDGDRLGRLQGGDHMALRANGQLSDVACLIPKALFNTYLYRGDYAEDLDLGIRLIQNGYTVAMLASIKVVHSHNRPPYYYLKRSFVDVVFLVDMFDDFAIPPVGTMGTLLPVILSVAAHLSDWADTFDPAPSARAMHDDIDALIRHWRGTLTRPRWQDTIRLGDARLDAYLTSLRDRFATQPPAGDTAAHDEAQRFVDAFLARLEHFARFARDVYGHQDAGLRTGLRGVIVKTFCATAGSALGFLYMSQKRGTSPVSPTTQTIADELKAGI